jgi:probable HAF family extracellular repeat protein
MPTASRYKPSVLLMSAIVGVVGAIGSATQVQAASFIGLGSTNDLESYVHGISADGSTVVGRYRNSSTNQTTQAFRWTQSGGMQGLGYLPSSQPISIALGVSGDGSIVVGSGSRSRLSEFRMEAFQWRQSGGMQGLGALIGDIFSPAPFFNPGPFPESANFSQATAISNNGSTIVGRSFGLNGREAFRWTQSEGMKGLGDLSGGDFYSDAVEASADGSTIVGESRSANGIEAFRWTLSGGMQGLGDLSGGSFFSTASDVSADGSIVVGSSRSANGTEAFRWTSLGGIQGLGFLSSSSFSSTEATAISADGSTVVGVSSAMASDEVSNISFNATTRNSGLSSSESFIWTESGGMKSLQRLLTDAGANLSGWKLNVATDVSADGRTIVGTGTNPNGRPEAWLARLDATPTPTAVPETTPITPLLAGLAALGISLGRKRNELI